MDKVFGYPAYNEKGEKLLTTYNDEYADMMMDVRVYQIKQGEMVTFWKDDEEIAVLLLKGKIRYYFGGEAVTTGCKNPFDGKITTVEYKNLLSGETADASRKNVFEEGPWCVHAPRQSAVAVEALEDAEVLVQATHNDREFPAKLYRPADAPYKYVCLGKFGNVAKRRVNTILDLDIAPYSNMVLGEVLNDYGNWSGYLPHKHPQPELYYFLFDRPEGFGASFVGDRVFKSTDGSFAAIPGGEVHPQAVAPGFMMYTCWMIRHLENQPWHQIDRNEDERYLWLHDAKLP